MKISATILTLNEQARIRACIESIAPIADEIVVVDSGSTDQTVKICRDMGCRVYTRQLAGFGAQRQYATSLTTHPYVLAIDADEVLSPALQQSLRELKATGPTHRGYAMERLNFYCGYAVKHCGWFPDVTTRLFDKRYANWNMHSSGEAVAFRDPVNPCLLKGHLLHYRCDSAEEYGQRIGTQARLRVARSPRSPLTSLPGYAMWRGLKAWWQMYVMRGGWLDGQVGASIARQHYFAEKKAWT